MTASQQPSKPIDANWDLVQVLRLDNPETSGWTCKGRTQSGRRCRRLLTLANRNAIEAILPKISSTPAVDETRDLNLLTRCCLCYGHDDDSTAETVALQWAKDLESARSGNAAEQTGSLASGAVHRQQRSASKKKPATEEQEHPNTQNKDKVDEEADTANPVPDSRRSSSSSPDLPSPPKLSLPDRTLRQTSQPSVSPPNQQDPAGPKISGGRKGYDGQLDPHSHDCDDQDDGGEEEEAENEGIEEEGDDDDDDDRETSEDEEYDMENEDEKAKAEKEHTKAEDEDADEQDNEEDDFDEQDAEADDEVDEEEEDDAEEEDGYESDEEDTGQEDEDDHRTAAEKAKHGNGKKADIDAEEEGDDVEEEDEEDSDIGYEDYVEGEEEDEEDDEEDPEIDTRSKATTGILHTKKLQEAPLGEVLRRSGRQRSELVDSLGGMSLR